VSGALFRRYADRLMASMIELAMGEIDNDDAVRTGSGGAPVITAHIYSPFNFFKTVTTPAGVKCGGNSWGKEISGASVQRSGAPGSDWYLLVIVWAFMPLFFFFSFFFFFFFFFFAFFFSVLVLFLAHISTFRVTNFKP
jgi:hypothetical protein